MPCAQGAHNTILSGLNPQEMDSSHSMKKLEFCPPTIAPKAKKEQKAKRKILERSCVRCNLTVYMDDHTKEEVLRKSSKLTVKD